MPLNEFPALSDGHILRKLECAYVYDTAGDDLFELDDESFNFLRGCNGRNELSSLLNGAEPGEYINFLLDEKIILMTDGNELRNIRAPVSPAPSLRYLLLNITDKCNLVCKHCYLGKRGNLEMDRDIFEKSLSQFEEMGGLKLMISGGEPLLHSMLWDLIDILTSYELRVVILSNGTLIDEAAARKLSSCADEVQISIDGINSHDILRGKDSYKKAMRGITNLMRSGIPVSIATMIHTYNAGEFEDMQKLFSGMDLLSWSVDVPCITGSLSVNQDLVLDIKEAAGYLKYGFGAGSHESTGKYTCGSHICAVSPDGLVSKCGFFDDEPVGNVNDLRSAWEKLCKNYLWDLDKLECHSCELIRECRGGCRFRAKKYKSILAPDPLMCHANGVLRFI